MTARRADALPATGDENPRSAPTRRSSRTLSNDSGARGGMDVIPPPPPLFRGGDSRGTTRRRRPSDVLDRSRRFNSGVDIPPISGAPGGIDSGAARRPISLPLLSRLNETETASSLTRPLQALQYADRDHSGGRALAFHRRGRRVLWTECPDRGGLFQAVLAYVSDAIPAKAWIFFEPTL